MCFGYGNSTSHDRLTGCYFHQLIRLAEATRHPLETLVVQSVVSNLPLMVDQVLVEMQAELLKIQGLSIE